MRGDPGRLPDVPISPTLAEGLARATVDVYADAELALLQILARRLRQGLERSSWAEDRLLGVQQVRLEAERVVVTLQRSAAAAAGEAVAIAYNRGWASAIADLERFRRRAAGVLPGGRAIDVLVSEAVRTVTATGGGIVRAVAEVYRSVVAQAAGRVLAGVATRRQAAQVALDRFAQRGITGFRDRAGRSWDLASYSEMAVRTATGHAAVQGHMDRLGAAGLDLVIVSDAPQECERCRPWEGKVLSRTGATVGAIEATDVLTGRPQRVHVAGSLAVARAAGLWHPNCFPGDVLVSAPSGVRAADARRYEGDVVVIHTASGNRLPVTPNHPVLTPEGWVAAGALQVGQRLLRDRSNIKWVNTVASGMCPDDQQVPARIGEIFDALRKASPMASVRVPATAEQFHGDGEGSDVEVVLADRLLENNLNAWAREDFGDGSLFFGGAGLGALLAESALDEVLVGAGHAAHSSMGGFRESGTLSGRHAGETAAHSFTRAELGTALDDPLTDAGLADAEGGRQLALRLAGQVALDEVVDLGRRQFAGNVYNLQSGDGWYLARGIVVHNCRHSASAYLPGVTSVPTHTADPQGDRDRQHLRYLERGVRAWKRRAAVALDEQARRRAAAKVRQWQAAIRAHVEATTAKRQPARERIGAAR
jgi:hypothetical protein